MNYFKKILLCSSLLMICNTMLSISFPVSVSFDTKSTRKALISLIGLSIAYPSAQLSYKGIKYALLKRKLKESDKQTPDNSKYSYITKPLNHYLIEPLNGMLATGIGLCGVIAGIGLILASEPLVENFKLYEPITSIKELFKVPTTPPAIPAAVPIVPGGAGGAPIGGGIAAVGAGAGIAAPAAQTSFWTDLTNYLSWGAGLT